MAAIHLHLHSDLRSLASLSFRACEGTWQAMNTSLTGQLSVKRTQHICVCVLQLAISWSPLTCILSLSCTLTGFWWQHRRSRSWSTPAAAPPPSDQISTIESCLRTSQSHRMIYHHHARQVLALSRTLLFSSRSMTVPVHRR